MDIPFPDVFKVGRQREDILHETQVTHTQDPPQKLWEMNMNLYKYMLHIICMYLYNFLLKEIKNYMVVF